MIRILPILIFLFIYVNINAQCINLQFGSACLSIDGETTLNFTAGDNCGNTDYNEWLVTSSNGGSEGIVSQGAPPFMNFYNVLINQEGTYTISDGIDQTIEYVVYPKPLFTSDVSSEYYLCDDSVNVQFQILPSNDFESFSWIGSATESENSVNAQFGDGFNNTFSATYLNTGEYDLEAQFYHIESGCLVRTEDEVTQNLNISIIQGPNIDNLVISVSSDVDNPNCVLVEADENMYAENFIRVPDFDVTINPLRHIGIYGYSFKTLNNIVNLEPTKSELEFKLEQLRFLENDYKIYVSHYDGYIPNGIDTEQDVIAANKYLQSK